MTGSSLGKYSGSAQYNSPEKGAAAANDTALAGASAARGAGGVCQGRGNELRALPRERSADVCSHSRSCLPRKQCKTQTSLQLSPLGFCLTVGSSHFLGRKTEEHEEQQCPSSSAVLPWHEPSTAPGCASRFSGKIFIFVPCFPEHGCFGGSWPSWENRSVKGAHK